MVGLTWASSAPALATGQYSQCPPVGPDSGCRYLIDLEGSGTQSWYTINRDASQPLLEADGDGLVGVTNNTTNNSLVSVTITYSQTIVQHGGICAAGLSPVPSGCPFGPTGYEGPGTQVTFDGPTEKVTFGSGLGPGQNAYFAIADGGALRATWGVRTTPTYAVPSWVELLGASGNSLEGLVKCICGDPVNTDTGNLVEQVADAVVPGPGEYLAEQRTYNSTSATAPGAASGRFGYGWSDSYSSALALSSDGTATFTLPDGGAIIFTPTSPGATTYSAPSYVFASLVRNADGSFTLTAPNKSTRTFNATGQLTALTSRAGETTTLTYDGGNLGTVTDASGRSLAFTYNSDGTVASLTDPLGRTWSYAYSGGNLASVTAPGNRTTAYSYTGTHLLATITNPRGGVTTNSYDANSRVSKQVDAMGRATSFDYSTAVDPTSGTYAGTTTMTKPNGDVENFAFDKWGRLTTRTDGSQTPAPRTWTYNYDERTGQIAGVKKPDGGFATSTHDARGNLTQFVDENFGFTNWTYNGANQVTSTTDPLNATTTYAYDALGNLISVSKPITAPDGTAQTATTTYEYGSSAFPSVATSVTDANGHTTSATLDSHGNTATQTRPDGATSVTTWDADGRVTSAASPRQAVAGKATTYHYDAAGNVADITDPTGHSEHQSYDDNGNPTSLTDRNGRTTTYAYNADDELTATTRPDGSTIAQTWTAGSTGGPGGGLLATQSNSASAVHYDYDPFGELISTSKPGGATTYGYDDAGNQTSITTPAGDVTTLAYDLAGHRTRATFSNDPSYPAGTGITYGYDADGRLVSMKDVTADGGVGLSTTANGSTTTVPIQPNATWTYDPSGRLLQTATPSGGGLTYAYDAAGNVTALTYPDGRIATKTYDAANRLTAETFTAPTDQDTGPFTAADDALHASFGYNADGDLTSIGYPDGSISSRSYDLNNAVTDIKDSISSAAGSGTSSPLTVLDLPYTRDAAEAITAQNLTPQVAVNALGIDTGATVTSEQATRNNDGRLTGLATKPAGLASVPRESYSYNTAGDLSGMSIGPVSQVLGSATLSYDDHEELTNQTSTASGQPALSTTFAYNANGDRTSETLRSPSSTGASALANTRLSYNQSGQLTGYEGAPITATWDAVNALGSGLINTLGGLTGSTGVTSLGLDEHLAYQYDGLGRLAGLTYDATAQANGASQGIVSDTLHDFLLGPNGMPIAQTTSLNVVNVALGGALTTGLSVEGTNITQTYATELSKVPPLTLHTDQLGSTRLVTADKTVSGNTVLVPLLDLDYNAYGAATTTTLDTLTGVSATNLLVPLQYAGYYTDLKSGLDYLQNRWYDPYTAQFISVDPALSLTAQPYAYANGDPLTYTDPFGLCWQGFDWACNAFNAASVEVYDGVNSAASYASNSNNWSTITGTGATIAYGFCWAGGSGCAVGGLLTTATTGLDLFGAAKNCRNGVGVSCIESGTALALDLTTYKLPKLSAYSGSHVNDWYKTTSMAGYSSLYSALGVTNTLWDQAVASLAGRGSADYPGLC